MTPNSGSACQLSPLHQIPLHTRWQELYSTFVTTGFPVTTEIGSYPIRHYSGNTGIVGAKYRYSFPVGTETSSNIEVITTLTDLVEDGDSTTIVYIHEYSVNDNVILSVLCAGPSIPWPNTETRFEISQTESGQRQVKISHTGPSASDPRERVGVGEICCVSGMLLVACPCCTPCVVAILKNLFELDPHLKKK